MADEALERLERVAQQLLEQSLALEKEKRSLEGRVASQQKELAACRSALEKLKSAEQSSREHKRQLDRMKKSRDEARRRIEKVLAMLAELEP